MSILARLDDVRLYQHSGAHIAHSDLEQILHVPRWHLQAGARWALLGGSERQRTALLDTLRKKLSAAGLRIAEVSMLEQEQLISAEARRNRSGVADEIYQGTSVQELLGDVAAQPDFMRSIDALGFAYCLDKRFRDLSSGETRRLLLLRALLGNAEVLLLHDPLEGLDSTARPVAARLLEQAPGKPGCKLVVFAASRAEQCPLQCTDIALIKNGVLHCTRLDARNTRETVLAQLASTGSTPARLPGLPAEHPYQQQTLADPAAPLVEMHDVTVSYSEQAEPVLNGLDWTVMPGQHWRISGANGSGKTTLLKLVSGDHPQVYKNNITVCGFRRGCGESIWQVKRHIGYMGGEMLWNYRGTAHAGKAIDVVMSGLYDSIGLYTVPNAADRQAAEQWLSLIGIQDRRRRFRQLGMAEQRLVLIARAMIKRPALLILDEPLQGLDGADRTRVLAIIEKLLAANAVTLLYVSHHDDEQVAGIHNELAL